MVCLMIRQPPRSTLFPNTALFRCGRGTFGRGTVTDRAAVSGDGLAVSADGRRVVTHEREDGGRVRFLVWDVPTRSEEHTSELQSRQYLVCRLLLEKQKTSEIAREL